MVFGIYLFDIKDAKYFSTLISFKKSDEVGRVLIE